MTANAPANSVGWKRLAPGLGLIVLALLSRAWLFGDPIIHVDEQFYFLTGGRMLHGSLPYVDIWDRKPIGLFLIYALAYAITHGNVIGYQLLATASAAATAILVRQIALRIANRSAAWIVAAAYLLYLLVFDGAGGQSPVFYNLPMAAAAMVLVNVANNPAANIRARGAAAMLLVGLAIQIKYTVVVEGMFFGVWLLWTNRKQGADHVTLALNGALWAVLALLPTALALGAYFALGHAGEFIQANFLSVFSRHDPLVESLKRLFWTIAELLPLLICLALARRPLWKSDSGRLLLGWSASAAFAYLAFGNYYDHYGLALLPPFCAAGAAGLEGRRARNFLAPALLLTSLLVGGFTVHARKRDLGSAADMDRLTAVVRQHLHGCLFMFEGHAILYDTANACFVSRYVFPYHLSAQKEAGALGVDVMAELRRIRSLHPSVVIILNRSRQQSNEAARQYVLGMLRQDYRFVAMVPTGNQKWLIYERRTAAGPAEQRVPAS